ncbi:hypothetical protein TNCV_633901 [Trichonephila clavipes]|nr:hypothetical protein TNCV_633901 [Trichonephila clavipes]
MRGEEKSSAPFSNTGMKLSNNLFSFSSARHSRQHLYRFVDYVNTRQRWKEKKSIKSVRESTPLLPFVAMATYFMLRESHKGDEEQSEPHPHPLYKYAKKRAKTRCIFNKAWKWKTTS